MRSRGLRRVDPRPRGRLFRTYARLAGAARPAMWFARRVMWSVDPVLLRATGGRVSIGPGMPTLLLDTTGARTGLRRSHAVIYFHDGDDVVVVASKFGDPEHPAWFHNAVANPDVLVNGLPHRATVVHDPGEQERLWALADQVLPAYAVYRERAARTGRTIPILRLVPQPADAGTSDGMPDDDPRAATRAELLPEEERAGSDDPQAQAEAILEESDVRTVDRDAAPGTHLEHRTSDDATPPPDL